MGEYIITFLLAVVLFTTTDGRPSGVESSHQQDIKDPTIPEQNIHLRKTSYITEENESLIEGDIINTTIHVRQDKMSVKNRELTWQSNTIPYTLDQAYSTAEKAIITSSMTDLENMMQSCIRFQERKYETDYLRITRTNGCYSSVGRTGGGQKLSLGVQCLYKGTIYHELMHALGFWHEHTRPDRDGYIDVILENILPDHHGDYKALRSDQVDLLDQTYDYGSIMHYSQRTFVVNKADPNMVTFKLLKNYQGEIGQRNNYSHTDLQKIYQLYKCNISECFDGPYELSYGMERKWSPESKKVGTIVTYRCYTDQNTLVGPSKIFCKNDGTWSGYEPKCLRSTGIQYCSFDSNTACGWTQDKNNKINWTLTKSKTETENTGPTVDNTLQNGAGGFMYVESSSPARPGDKVRLISPMINSMGEKQCLSLYYHMYGLQMGNLSIYYRPVGQNEQTLKIISGNKENAWHHLEIHFTPATNKYNIEIEAVVNGYLSDIAIDDVLIKDCSLGSGDIQQTTTTTELYNVGVQEHPIVIYSCDFNNGLCGWSQDTNDDFDWSVTSGSTPTYLTGPDCDRTNCSYGKYIYLEASGSAVLNDRARIRSNVFQEVGTFCLTFYVNMYGDDTGKLEINANVGNNSLIRLWQQSGNQDRGWKKRTTEFKALSPFQLEVTGTRGNGYRGDIGLDDILMTIGSCQVEINCDFEDDFCDWENDNFDDFDWTRNRGSTPTPNTGPSNDHTSSSGYYIYLESSAPRRRYDIARLKSKEIKTQQKNMCLRFWFHMYGEHVSHLRVIRANSTGGQEEHLWKMLNNQGNIWREASVDLHNANVPFKIVIEGEVGSSYKGDIGIDDITLTDGKCSYVNYIISQ